MFVSQAIVSIVSSAFLILGAGTLLLVTNWKLGLATLVILPIIAISFRSIFTRVGGLFASSQQVVDRLNKTINESILGAALIRILNAQVPEGRKFEAVNTEAKDIGFKILGVFSGVIPIITFVASMATIIVLAFGGHLVIVGDMTVGELAAFNGYLSLLIFPIFIIGFMSNAIARAGASYGRILAVLELPDAEEKGTLAQPIRGDIVADKVSVRYGEKPVLKEASFAVKAGTRTAVIGPTAAGKTQLLQVLTGLIPPTSGAVRYDGQDIAAYKKGSFHAQVAFVFQDSVLFNASVRENIAFSASVTPEAMDKAIATAELGDFIASLPQGIETVVSERGTSLSGGQKQRVMLARALALGPTVLILDDFTARVDVETEKRILANVRKNYPGITVVSVTQKIAPVEDYDQIVLLMEGEILAAGTHAKLLETSPEYVQIVESQKSTEQYESHA
jgi:ATP-binding cassette subfamily B protein